ncbi:DNA repair ATPase-like protein [Neokomagataea thailandica NBRC 106555]|uniref:Endonuclease GajA/Old nuclease/RecF-like AAA domain-containing protein n=2 Tax=Neokomagataea TaxID=1223423 RepID=A0A4Y6V5L5_9PROT|nr:MULTISPECIES: AAA family ATPase [Neokomagataea]QDH25412.1 hypothetical protein D5366_09525 [Neokomagataea tanensis]GBR53565.1 DNA repair ATPase-like protein [Neokomagataea thailandica NBRC 106555]
MSLYLQKIELENFRRFRQPVQLDGLTEGLNILIAPNEAGKSTLLEALKAAFFVKAKGASKQHKSYLPYGDKVSPSVAVRFQFKNQTWQIEKTFMQGAKTVLSGPEGRYEGEDAEYHLREQLGAVAAGGAGKKAEPEGALGMLWVRQAAALTLDAPDEFVRDKLSATLEHEVGAIVGGRAFNRVKEGIDQLSMRYGTARSRTQGLYPEAQLRSDRAEEAYKHAQSLHYALEEKFSELEQVRIRLRQVEREVNSEEDQQKRAQLQKDLQNAESAVQNVQLRRAEHEAAQRVAYDLGELEKHAETLKQEALRIEAELTQAQAQCAVFDEQVVEKRVEITALEGDLDCKRSELRSLREAAKNADHQHAAANRRDALLDAQKRYEQLCACEEALTKAQKVISLMLPDSALIALDKAERDVANKRALIEADAARIIVSGDLSTLSIDGRPAVSGEIKIDKIISLSVGGAHLRLEPSRSAQRARFDYQAAVDTLARLLNEAGVESIAEARQRNERARQAQIDTKHLHERISTLCPADKRMDLGSGAEALKALVLSTDFAAIAGGGDAELPDMEAIYKAVEEAEDSLSRREKTLDLQRVQLNELEKNVHPVALKIATLRAEQERNARDKERLMQHPDWEQHSTKLLQARERLAGSVLGLRDAERLVDISNPEAIKIKIARLDQYQQSLAHQRSSLRDELSSLEATVAAEGGKGLAERLVAAEEEQAAADEAKRRIKDDVEALQLLQGVLDEARVEMSGRFVAPVARRAKAYIEKILPNTAPGFDENLKLAHLTRGLTAEESDDLSKGTQEQLAVIVRLAFADILQQQGQAVSLILDDPLVYADDARLELMLDMLEEASGRLQIIILTCREHAFRLAGGKRLFLPLSGKKE